MTITKMNGKPLLYQGFADFDDPMRAITTGRHTTIEAWEATMKRSACHGRALYGWVWAEYHEPNTTANPGGLKTRIVELVLRPQKAWADARIRANRENELIVVMTHYATCCTRLNYVMDDHLRTARHFRYWAMEHQEDAVMFWPWLRELIAEEVLTCSERR
jgi:hypothetical protein